MWASSSCVWASHCRGFSCCRTWALGCFDSWWHMALVAPWYVESSQTRDQTCNPPDSSIPHCLLKLAQYMSIDQWCCLNISSSAAPFSFCLQAFPASGSFPVSWLFTSGGQSNGVSASASVLPVNIQDWFPLGLTDLITLQSKGLSRHCDRLVKYSFRLVLLLTLNEVFYNYAKDYVK